MEASAFEVWCLWVQCMQSPVHVEASACGGQCIQSLVLVVPVHVESIACGGQCMWRLVHVGSGVKYNAYGVQCMWYSLEFCMQYSCLHYI